MYWRQECVYLFSIKVVVVCLLSILLDSIIYTTGCLFPVGFPPKSFAHSSSGICVQHSPPIALSVFASPEKYFASSTELEVVVMQSFTVFCYFRPVRLKYPPQQPILERCEPTFLS